MLTTLHFSIDTNPEAVAAAVKEVWHRSKVIHLKDLRPSEDLRAFYMRFFGVIGRPLHLAEDASVEDRHAQRTGGIWFEVRYDPRFRDAYRHSANAQPLHTDGSYIPSFPNAGFLACQSMPRSGGATVFIDAQDVVNALRAESPDLLHRLEREPIRHTRSGDSRTEPALRYEDGEPLVNWNYYCVDPGAAPSIKLLSNELFAFLKGSAAVSAKIVRVKLQPGEAVMWKDDRVLHGRDDFDPEGTSDRFLWKAAVQVDA